MKLQISALAAAIAVGAAATMSAGTVLAQQVVKVDGSSTVYPVTEAVAEDFQKSKKNAIKVTVGISGTGGGFKKFCRGEIDVSNASRPILKKEMEDCKKAGIEYIELPVAFDALTVVINPQNDFVKQLTVAELKKMWEPGAQGKVKSWKEVNPAFPDVPLKLFGPGSDSGTFDYFTAAINGEEGAIRADYSPSEDDNITVQGVSGALGGIGFFGLSYVEENADVIKAVTVDGVYPTVETVQDGSYTPLGRPLFIYVANASYLEKPQVKAFVDYYVENAVSIAEAALFVPLTADQITLAADELASLG